jgi:hypothetical protein
MIRVNKLLSEGAGTTRSNVGFVCRVAIDQNFSDHPGPLIAGSQREGQPQRCNRPISLLRLFNQSQSLRLPSLMQSISAPRAADRVEEPFRARADRAEQLVVHWKLARPQRPAELANGAATPDRLDSYLAASL